MTLSTGDAALVRRLLGDALGSGEPLETVSASAFFRALDTTSLYCDFLVPLPLGVLAGLMDAASPDESAVRCALIAEEGEEVRLFLWDGERGYRRCAAPISVQELEEAVRRYELGSAFFAMDRAPEEAVYGAVTPLSLFLEETPRLPVLSAVSGFPDTDRLLTALRFNPLTNFRYPEPNGTEVVVENGRSLRIRANGSVYYQSGGQDDLSLEYPGEVLPLWEAVSLTCSLLNTLLPEEDGASLCPVKVWREEERVQVRFGYQAQGVPVRFSDGGYAASVTLDGRSVSFLELRSRQYAPTDPESLLLPLPQAVGVAALTPGRELFLGYDDSGEAAVPACWLFS